MQESSIRKNCTPKIWMACDDRTLKILNMKLRRAVITRGVFLLVQAW